MLLYITKITVSNEQINNYTHKQTPIPFKGMGILVVFN